MNNTWNKLIYKLWSPIYDRFFNTGYFLAARKKVFQETAFTRKQKILFVGIGTGADLELINHAELDITAIDFSPDMLKKAKMKYPNSSIRFLEMDAQDMKFENNHFDRVVGSLILSVVPDADSCFREMARVLKPGGEMILFDKFLPKEKEPSLFKKSIRPAIRLLGTDIGLNFEELFEKNKTDFLIKENSTVMFHGMYRKILLSKRNPS